MSKPAKSSRWGRAGHNSVHEHDDKKKNKNQKKQDDSFLIFSPPKTIWVQLAQSKLRGSGAWARWPWLLMSNRGQNADEDSREALCLSHPTVRVRPQRGSHHVTEHLSAFIACFLGIARGLVSPRVCTYPLSTPRPSPPPSHPCFKPFNAI